MQQKCSQSHTIHLQDLTVIAVQDPRTPRTSDHAEIIARLVPILRHMLSHAGCFELTGTVPKIMRSVYAIG